MENTPVSVVTALLWASRFPGTCLPSRCSETAVCLFVYCIVTAVYAKLFCVSEFFCTKSVRIRLISVTRTFLSSLLPLWIRPQYHPSVKWDGIVSYRLISGLSNWGMRAALHLCGPWRVHFHTPKYVWMLSFFFNKGSDLCGNRT
jgi:hypothetical protein